MKTNHPQKRPAFHLAAVLGLTLLAAATAQAQNGTWTNLIGGDASGSWATAANWDNGTVANGANNTADFSTLDLTTNSTVTLDGARVIGNLTFDDSAADTNGYSAWVLNTGSGGPLTLEGTAPLLSSTNASATLNLQLSGISGLTKVGSGTVVLANNANDISGNIVVAEGVLLADGPNNTGGTVLGAVSVVGGDNLVIVTNGATLGIDASTRFNNNKQFFIEGDGVDGTLGAIYADLTGTANNTRLGDYTIAGGQQVVLMTNATIRIDGTAAATVSPNADQLLIQGFALGGFTLTKTGGGTLAWSGTSGAKDSGAGLIYLKEGGINSRQNRIGYGRDLTIDAGAWFWPIASAALNAGSGTVTVNGTLSLNSRGTAGDMTQTASLLFGNGTITAGEVATAHNNNFLVVGGNNSTNDSVFDGTITEAPLVTVHLTKNQSNSLTLNGTNDYNGLTTVNSGTLVVNGAHKGTGGYLVTAGATLTGAGTITSTVTNQGILTPTAGGTLTLLSDIVPNLSYTDTINVADGTLAVRGKIGNGAAFDLAATMILSNGTLELPLDLGAVSASVSTLNVEAPSTLAFTTDSPATGQFPFISYSSLGGAAGFAGLSLTTPAGVTATLSNNVANSTIDVVVTGVPALTWNGNVNGDWDLGLTANWKGPAVWSEPNGAIFNDSASGVTTVNVTTTVNPDAVVVNNTSKSYSFTGAGDISGPAALVKNGSGTLTVANHNTFSGSVALNAGTLRVGNGGTTGSLGSGALNNSATLVLDRTDNFTLENTVTLTGAGAALTKQGAGTAVVPLAGDVSGIITVNGGTLAVAPSGTVKISSDITGTGAFGVAGTGTTILSGFLNSWSGGTVISNGTLQIGDEFGSGTLPSGNIANDGTLTLALFATLPNNISGSGGVSVISNQFVTLSGVNTYSGPTYLEGTLSAASAGSYPAASELVLGNVEGGALSGTANFSGFNPVTGGLKAGSSGFPGGSVHLGTGSQSLTVNGDVLVGVATPNNASVTFTVVDDEYSAAKSMSVVKDGGTIQLGYNSQAANGTVADTVLVDLTQLHSFHANLGATGLLNLGSVNGGAPPGSIIPPAELRLAAGSNLLSIGTVNIGAGQRGARGELTLGGGTNVINADTLNIGSSGRDAGSLYFQTTAIGSGSLRIRAFDGIGRANLGIGDNSSGTGATSTNWFDVAGNYADLLIDQLVIGNEPTRNGVWEQTFNFDQGILDALSVSISAADRNDGAHGTDEASSTVNLGGGTVTFGPVGLVGDSAAGTLNVTGGSFTAASITDSGVGTSTFNLSAPTFTLDLVGFGNPATAPVVVDNFNPSGAVNLHVNATGLAVGQFELIKYGTMGGTGFGALSLASLPPSVVGSLSNNIANSSVDLVITSAPVVVNPNPTNLEVGVSGGVLRLSWPEDHTGWQLQSNAVSVADSASWFPVPGSTTTNLVTLPVNLSKTNVFFRMFLP